MDSLLLYIRLLIMLLMLMVHTHIMQFIMQIIQHSMLQHKKYLQLRNM